MKTLILKNYKGNKEIILPFSSIRIVKNTARIISGNDIFIIHLNGEWEIKDPAYARNDELIASFGGVEFNNTK